MLRVPPPFISGHPSPGPTIDSFFHRPSLISSRASAEGSSSVQTLGGMSGVLVVEDPPGTLPVELEAMREVVMVVQETNVESGESQKCVSGCDLLVNNHAACWGYSRYILPGTTVYYGTRRGSRHACRENRHYVRGIVFPGVVTCLRAIGLLWDGTCFSPGPTR